MHVVTANKGPLAHAYAALRDEAARAGVAFRFESAVMDGAPVFNLWRHTMPGVKVLGLHRRSELDVEGRHRNHGAGRLVRRRPGARPRNGHHRSRRRLRRRGLGFRGQNRRPRQRPDGRAHDPAGSLDPRHHEADARTRAGNGARGQDRAAGQPRNQERIRASACACAPWCSTARTSWPARPALRT